MRIGIVLLFFANTFLLSAQNASGEPWWQQQPLRLIDLVTGMDGINFRAPADVAARKAELEFNSEHLDVMGFVPGGMDDSRFFFRSKVGKMPQDYLASYLPEAKKRGIRVIIYFNVHWYTHEFGRRHPDWLQITEDGPPLDGIYDTGTSFCMNSPWREWVFQVLRDLCRYPIDGIFFDGPVFFEKTCYCPACRAKFRKLYGREMPSKRSIQGKDFHDLVEFQARSISEFLKESNAIIKSKNSQIAFYMNGGARGSNWATGRLNRILVENQDLLGSEGGFIYSDLTQIPLWKAGVTARLLETQAPDKPRVIFSAAAHKPWTYSILPAPELRLLYADTIANAANVWFCLTPKEFYQPETNALRDMNAFVARHGEYLLHTRSAARTAIVWSDTTANSYAGSDAQLIDINVVKQRSGVGNLGGEFNGLTDAILRSHTPFDVIDDVTLEKEPLGRYSAIYLPNVACMSQKSAARLREYVRNGGNLFATFETSLYDEYGIRRPDFALADLFGVTSRNHISGPHHWDAEKPVAKGALMAGLEERELIPSTLYYVEVRATTAQTLVENMKAMRGRYDGLSGVSADPALLVNHFGKGTVVYSAGDIGNVISAYHIADFYQFVGNAALTLAPPLVTLRNCPESVEVVLRAQPGRSRTMLHLVNFTGEMTRPIRNILPQRDVCVTLTAGIPGKRVYTLVTPRELPARKDSAGRLSFTVPRLDEYEVLVIEP